LKKKAKTIVPVFLYVKTGKKMLEIMIPAFLYAKLKKSQK
jgi:hypothetical protein